MMVAFGAGKAWVGGGMKWGQGWEDKGRIQGWVGDGHKLERRLNLDCWNYCCGHA